MPNEPEALAANGWVFYEKCRCSGVIKWKYRNPAHPDLELEWWVKHYKFRIMYRGSSTKVTITPVKEMDKILKAL